MAQTNPTIETVNASDARQNFSQLLNRVFRGETRILVEKSGLPVAAIVSADDLQRLADFDAKRVEQAGLFKRMRAAFSDVPEEQIATDVSRVIADVRQRERSRASSLPS